MLRLQAYKFELMPDGAQERDMRRFAGACRFVFNKALAQQQANREAGGKYIGHFDMCKWLPIWKQEIAWLKDSPSHTLQKALKDLDRAYKNFFAGRAKFPRFKRKGMGESFQEFDPKCFKLDEPNARIFLPKLGWMRYRKSRSVLGTLKSITVSQTGGKWLASIQTERDVEISLPTATSAIGIDVGIARFATFSDGSFAAPLSSFKRHEIRLARYQRRMSRKKKFSANWKKAKAKVTQCHIQIANTRKDYLHKLTSTISQSHALVCVEDLKIQNMSSSAAGTADEPGKNVAAKSGLNKAILDQGWFEFSRQLEYKMNWDGGMLLAVPAHHTSQTCPACKKVAKANRQSQSKFLCVACGYANNADVVGAMNILERGQRLIACGEDVRHVKALKPKRAASVKQEPTEVTGQGVILV